MLNYTQLAQSRLPTTSPTSIYQCGVGEQVQLFIKFANLINAPVKIRVFHDHVGSTYDETTAILWDHQIFPGGTYEMDHVFVNNPSGNLAYRTDTANGINATVYGVVRSE